MLKATGGAVLIVAAIFGTGGAILLIGLVIMLACLPLFATLGALLGIEALIWRHWRNVRENGPSAAFGATHKGNGAAITSGH